MIRVNLERAVVICGRECVRSVIVGRLGLSVALKSLYCSGAEGFIVACLPRLYCCRSVGVFCFEKKVRGYRITVIRWRNKLRFQVLPDSLVDLCWSCSLIKVELGFFWIYLEPYYQYSRTVYFQLKDSRADWGSESWGENSWLRHPRLVLLFQPRRISRFPYLKTEIGKLRVKSVLIVLVASVNFSAFRVSWAYIYHD